MCEILTLKYNKKGIKFELEAIETALKNNPDGAGYAILKKNRDSWELVEEIKFHLSPSRKSFGRTDDYGWKMSEEYQNFLNYYPEQEYDSQYVSLEKLDNRYQKIADDFYEKQAELKPGQIMIMHFRLATSGFSAQSAQPILNGNYLVIHNGIFNLDSIPGESDTLSFTRLINSKLKASNVKTVSQERKMLEECLSSAGGYWSVYIYSWKTKQLHYFKSELARFNVSQDGLMYSTSEYRFPPTHRTAESHLL